MSAPKLLRHNVVDLALHTLREGAHGATPLLLLHGLGERTPTEAPAWTASWQGPVLGLDFTGHGASTVPTGGGYSAEVLMGDVDVALADVGPCAVAGRGLGAYVALLIAGGVLYTGYGSRRWSLPDLQHRSSGGFGVGASSVRI